MLSLKEELLNLRHEQTAAATSARERGNKEWRSRLAGLQSELADEMSRLSTLAPPSTPPPSPPSSPAALAGMTVAPPLPPPMVPAQPQAQPPPSQHLLLLHQQLQQQTQYGAMQQSPPFLQSPLPPTPGHWAPAGLAAIGGPRPPASAAVAAAAEVIAGSTPIDLDDDGHASLADTLAAAGAGLPGHPGWVYAPTSPP